MVTTSDDIERWFEAGKTQGATHLIVVTDTFDYTDYPVYVSKKEDAKKLVEKKYSGQNMQKAMEVYNLKKDMQKQLMTHRSWNY